MKEDKILDSEKENNESPNGKLSIIHLFITISLFCILLAVVLYDHNTFNPPLFLKTIVQVLSFIFLINILFGIVAVFQCLRKGEKKTLLMKVSLVGNIIAFLIYLTLNILPFIRFT